MNIFNSLYCVSKNATFLFFRITLVKCGQISIIFGTLSPEETLHQNVVNLSTSPEICHRNNWNLVKCRTSIHWLFVTGIFLRNFLFKQLRCELKISKSIDFYCFLNLFTPKLYRFPHKNEPNFMLWKIGQQCLRTLKATWPIRFSQLLHALFLQTLPWRHKLEAISEKISKQLWFQLHSDTVFVLLKDSQNTRKPMSDVLENHFLEFHKVLRWHISGEVDQFKIFWCDVSSRLRVPKIIEIGSRLTELF